LLKPGNGYIAECRVVAIQRLQDEGIFQSLHGRRLAPSPTQVNLPSWGFFRINEPAPQTPSTLPCMSEANLSAPAIKVARRRRLEQLCS
jgi:hypothetical protein